MKISVEFDSLTEMKKFINTFADDQVTDNPVTPSAQTAVPTVIATPTQPAAPTPSVVPMQPVVPTVQQAYSIDDLSRAAVALMDAGKQQELLTLLQTFGVEAIPQLPKEQYGAFATALRQKGAQI